MNTYKIEICLSDEEEDMLRDICTRYRALTGRTRTREQMLVSTLDLFIDTALEKQSELISIVENHRKGEGNE